MIEKFKYKGEFYLPSDKKNKVLGILTFDPLVGSELDLIGSFGPNHKNEQEIIWGILENGKGVTLYNSFINSQKFSFNSFAKRIDKYTVNFIFFDIFFNDKKDLKFNKVSVFYSYLDEWLDISTGFKTDHDFKDFKLKIEYELPKKVKVQLANDATLTIALNASLPNSMYGVKEMKIQQKAYIILSFQRKIHFDSALENIFHFQHFLTLVTQVPIHTTELLGHVRIKGEKELVESKIIFTQRKHENKQISAHDMLLPYNFFKDDFPSVIKLWFDLKEKLEPATLPFFGAYYNKSIYTTDKFLNLSRSMEAFHRDFINRNSVNRTRFREILQNISPAYNWLLKIRSKPKYVHKILQYRNNFTHSNPMLSNKDKRYFELHNISENLKIVMSCTFLHEIGLSKKDLKTCLDKTRLYTHLKYPHKR